MYPEMVIDVDVSTDNLIVIWVRQFLNQIEIIKERDKKSNCLDSSRSLLTTVGGRRFIDNHTQFRTTVLNKVKVLAGDDQRLLPFQEKYSIYWSM